jgi:hypothetical protein
LNVSRDGSQKKDYRVRIRHGFQDEKKTSTKKSDHEDTDAGIHVRLAAGDPILDSLLETQALFNKDGFVRLDGILPTSAITDLHRFSQERFHRVFEQLHQNGHTLFPQSLAGLMLIADTWGASMLYCSQAWLPGNRHAKSRPIRNSLLIQRSGFRKSQADPLSNRFRSTSEARTGTKFRYVIYLLVISTPGIYRTKLACRWGTRQFAEHLCHVTS